MVRIQATLAVLLLLLIQTTAWAQATGSIAGTVEDDTGGVLPGVTVSVTVGPKTVGETVTDASGVYKFEKVPAGSAELTFRLINFSSGRRMVTVTPGTTTTANVRMVVAVSADIVITATRTFRNLAEIENPAENLVGIAVGGQRRAPSPPRSWPCGR